MARRRSRGQSGFTLVEALLAIVFIATVVVGLISGLFTAMIASSTNEDSQRIEAALVSYGASVKRMPYDTTCAAVDGTYSTAYNSWPEPGKWQVPAGMTALIRKPKYWRNVATGGGGGDRGWASSCPNGSDPGVQLLTLEISYNGKTQSNQIVKRNPTARPA
jgi:type II secretory pathway pseudopilin PulG